MLDDHDPSHFGLSVDVRSESELQIQAPREVQSSTLTITGESCAFHLGPNARLYNCNFRIESNESTIQIDENVIFRGSIFLKGKGSNFVHIGGDSSCGQATIICGEGSTVRIGIDCMLAWGLEIRTTDSHAIFDIDTGERINPPADISIGDHVWIGAKSMILKGSIIADGSVVGMGALVSREFGEPNNLIVGNPARVVRTGVRWERPLLG